MNRRSKNILIFMLVLAGLLVATLYSPIGNQSPGDYTSLYYYSINPGVQFGGGIANAHTSYHSIGKYKKDLMIPDEQMVTTTITPKYSASSSVDVDNNLGSANQISKGVNVTKQPQENPGIYSEVMAVAYGYRKSGSNNQAENHDYGFTAISSDLTTTTISNTNNPTTKQSVGNSLADVSDPGGDPTGPIIPVGDGWTFLLFLAGTYAVIKRFVLK